LTLPRINSNYLTISLLFPLCTLYVPCPSFMLLQFHLDSASVNLASAVFLALSSLAVYILRGNESPMGSLSITALGLLFASAALFTFGISAQPRSQDYGMLAWPLMIAASTLVASGLRSTCGPRDRLGLLLAFFGTTTLTILLLDSNNREMAFDAILLLCLAAWFEAALNQDSSHAEAKKVRRVGFCVIATFFGWLLLDSLSIASETTTSGVNRIDLAIALCACALMVVWSVQTQHRQDIIKRIQLDPLTGLASREYLLEHSEKWVKNHPMGLALMVIDIDHFRTINERYGHQVGDSVLRHVGKRLKQSVRKDTLVARYGGEEFGLIVPVSDKEEAAKVAERLRFEIEQSPFFMGAEAIQLTVSIGLTLYDHNVSLSKALVDADTRLHDAKQTGRNRVVAAFA
jgi:diguanylate cyclase (GGDEF)-like protein